MSSYNVNQLEANQKKLTSFRGEECYVTFYRESDYSAGKLRSQMTPVGAYLYATGVSITENASELTPMQGFGSATKNLFAPGVVESTLNISALYCQEGSDLTWMAPGHSPLLAFIDFVDSTHIKKSANDSLNSNLDYVQTIVIRNLRRANRTITSNTGNGVTYALSFAGGDVTTLANGVMDLP